MNSEIHYREIKDYNEYSKLEEIQFDAWNFPERELVPKRLFYATRKSGGVVIGAYIENELVGYCWGWVGNKEPYGTFIYSHHNAVRKKYQNKGIGYNLKKVQRDWGIKNGYEQINWTFDPLQSKNCYLNLHKLGAISETYYENYWGKMNDDLNRGIETDRIYCNWKLNSQSVKNRINNIYDDYQKNFVNEESQILEIEKKDVLLNPTEIYLDKKEDVLFLQIPHNFNYLIRHKKKEIKKWRKVTRKLFHTYFEKDYILADFIVEREDNTIACYHVFKKKRSV